MSGDLKDPKKSIPKGTILATAVGICVYFAVAIKLSMSANVNILGNPDNQLIMSDIAIWGPIIPIGLACAAISSALGSVIIAPRTLQALGNDSVFPFQRLNKWFKKERVRDNEPINGAIITSIIAFFFIGVYGGFINAGIGFVIMLFLHYYNRLNLVKVNSAKVVIVLIYTTGAFITFALAGKVNWTFGLFLALGNVLAGWTSSRWSVKKGEKSIKVFLVVMIILMSIKLLFPDLVSQGYEFVIQKFF